MFANTGTKTKAVGLFLFFGIFFLNTNVFAIDVKGIFKRTQSSVVLIMSFDENSQPLAIGSGFFIGNGKLIATNYHVIEGASSIRIKLTSGQVEEIKKVKSFNLEEDLALLISEISGVPLELDENTPQVGDDILAIGNPKGLEGTLSNGIVSGIREDNELTYYQVTAAISPGSSGGPIINEKGKVIGVSTFHVKGGQSLNFAMPSSYISKLMKVEAITSISQLPGMSSIEYEEPDPRVKIIESRPWPEKVIGSVLNETDEFIKDVRVLVVFYPPLKYPPYEPLPGEQEKLRKDFERNLLLYGSGATVENPRYDEYLKNRKPLPQKPIHYMLLNINEVIPPGLAVRFQRSDELISFSWSRSFRVLDYSIIDSVGSSKKGIPVFE